MATTDLTQNVQYELPLDLTSEAAWGPLIRKAWQDTDLRQGARTSINISPDADITLTRPQWLNRLIDFPGTLTLADRIVTFPDQNLIWLVRNGTSGSFNLMVRAGISGAQIALPKGVWAILQAPGSGGAIEIIEVWAATTFGSTLLPDTDGTLDIGSGTQRWKDIHATNGTIITSDARMKEGIEPIPEKLLQMFHSLEPRVYRHRNQSEQHVGLIAQDVLEAMQECGISETEFAGLVRSPMADGDEILGLRMSEFTGLLIAIIQQLVDDFAGLEQQVMDIKAALSERGIHVEPMGR